MNSRVTSKLVCYLSIMNLDILNIGGEKGKLDDGFVICVVAAKKRLTKGPREGYRTVPK